MHEGPTNSVVVGDARRKQLWIGAFEGIELSRAFTLIDPQRVTDVDSKPYSGSESGL